MGDNIKINLEYPFDATTDELKEKLKEFVNANLLSEKQQLLKELSQYMSTPENTECVVMLICHIYLSTTSKHPIKKTCTRLLMSMDVELVKTIMSKQILFAIHKTSIGLSKPDDDNDQIQSSVELNNHNNSESESDISSNVSTSGDVEADKVRSDFIVIMQGLFGNFPAGVEALNAITDIVFLFAFGLFVRSFKYIELEVIPLEIPQQMMFDSAKFLDTLLHHCDTSVHLPNESNALLVTTYKAIRHEKIAFNTKAHCGALLVMAVVQCPDNLEPEELQKLATLFHIPSLTAEDNLLTSMLQSCSDCYTTRICIFSGIVHTCPLTVMSKYMVDDQLVAVYIFKKMLEIAMIRSNIAAEILEISRTLVSLSPLICELSVDVASDIIKGCWDYIWMHLDHFVDAVRNDAQKLLKTVISITLKLTSADGATNGDVIASSLNNPYVQMFINSISEIVQGQNPNFKALSHIATQMQLKKLLEIFPSLPQSLLYALENSSVAQDVCVTYERLMFQHHKEMPETWIEFWVNPLLPLNQSDSIISYILKIFNSAFRLSPIVVSLVKNTNYTTAEYCALLGCCITARKNNIKLDNVLSSSTNEPATWTTVFSKKHLQILICHQSPEIRILVLTLLVECQKSTEIFLPEDFKLLITFFRYNTSSCLPHFRQSVVALYKKALNRFKCSFYVIQRSIRNEETRGAAADYKKLTSSREVEANYKQFIVTLFHQQLIRGLFYQAEYGKRALCLELLLHLKTCVPEDMYNAQWYPDYMHMLFNAFDDTYEANLIMLRKLMLGLPPENVYRQSNLKDLEDVLMKPFSQIGFDIKSNVTTSATYAILVHVRSPHALDLIRKAYGITDDSETSPAMLVYRELTKQINNELGVVRKDVNMAAKYAPVYGVLFVLRHLIREEELDTKHPEIVSTLINQCLNIVELALPVVNSSAPEGYNPQIDGYERADVTPQLVLHYAWRTIKEVSLLFGEVQINHPGVKKVLKRDGLLEKMAKYFIELFESAKHRGAYEQGYVGFAKLAENLWNSDCDWSKLPEQWLEDAMDLISSTDAKLCATRRSAGIPFLIQGILVSEPKHRANQSFHYCMQYLLKVASDYSEDNQTSAIHSMNILRALYRHNQLGEVVASYVSQGVMISITQFSHLEWAIRNSATLMFSALMMRIFGVQRLKDTEEISIKNRLPFKVFKTRYPDLYNFLFEKLDEYIETDVENVSLYPVLVILGRIYLTFDSKRDVKITDHYNALLKATTRTIHKIRELAVNATVSFESFLNPREEDEKVTNNQIHGFLLRLKHYVRMQPQNANKIHLSYFKPLLLIISNAGECIAQTCTTLLMEILIEFLQSYDYNHEDLDTYHQLLGHLHAKQSTVVSTCTRFQQTRFTLYLYVIMKIPQAQWYTRTFLASALLQALTSRNEDLNIYALNCIRYISSENLEEPETKELEFEFVQGLSSQTKALLNYIIRVHLIKNRTFMDLFDILRNRSPIYGLKVCQVLYNYPSIVYTIRPLAVPVRLSHQMILNYLNRQATCINSDMFVAIMGLISKFVAGSNEPLDLGELIEHMEEFGGDDSIMDERLAIANFLLQNYNLLVCADVMCVISRLKLWNIYFELIQDDELVVREFCTLISHRIINAINTKRSIPLENESYMKNFPMIPERLHESVLAILPYFLGTNESLKIYVRLSLKFHESFEYTDEKTIYDKQRPHFYKESRPFAPQSQQFLACSLWKLDPLLSHKDRSIFLEEHFLLVATRLLNLILSQDDTDDRSLCVAVLVRFSRYLERAKVGTASAEQILDNFVIAFKAADAAERARNKTMCTCVTEVSQFLSFVLFSQHINL